MATCQTSQWVSTSPYVKLTVTESSSTATTSTLSWSLQYVADYAASTSVSRSYTVKIDGDTVANSTYNINGKSGTNTITSGTKTITKTKSSQKITFSVSFAFELTWSGTYAGTKSASGSINVPAITSYTIKYNSNGGSGAPSSQTKWHGTSLTLSATKPTKNGYTFKGWATSSSGSVAYAAGATYSSNSSTTLYAVWQAITYTVKYNANGGAGAPSNQTKTYGTNLTLSSTKPTRKNYTFKGWGTSASSTTVAYLPASSYTKNAAITLYAIWTLSYVKPRISNVSIQRCNSSGIVTDDGTYALVSFDWATDLSITSAVVMWKLPSSTSWSSSSVTVSGTSGTGSKVVGAGTLSTESTYDFQITVSDSNGTSYVIGDLTSQAFIIDVLPNGKGIAFGKTAELEGVAEFEFDAQFNGNVRGKVLGLNKVPLIPANSNLNDYMEPGCYAIRTNAIAATISNVPLAAAGRLEVISSTGEGILASEYSYIRQRYIPYTLANPTWERDITRNSSNVWTYGAWYRTSISSGVTADVYHEQKVLWSGSWYMNASQTANLSENISKQPNGIVLVFSRYSDGAAQNHNFNSFFVPKQFVQLHSGGGCSFLIMSATFEYACSKYLYISDSSISGHASNNATGTGSNGVTYANNGYVLRYVIGV